MLPYKTNQDFYNDIDSLVLLLRNDGYTSEADKINVLLHKVAWTTTSELFGELRDVFAGFVSQNTKIPDPIKQKLNLFIATIDKAWDAANGKL